MTELFGKNIVKGIANTELTPELVFKLGQAAAAVFINRVSESPRVLIGKDTRVSGDMIEAALSAGLCSAGAKAVSVGVIPAPAVAYLTKKYKMDAGVVISASDDAMEYNAIKFLEFDGCPIDDEMQKSVEEYTLGRKNVSCYLKSGEKIGRITRTHTGLRDYVDFIKSTTDIDFSGVKIVIDCSNGATYQSAKLVFKELDADVEMMNNVPDGVNINDGCGFNGIDKLKSHIISHKCTMGIAFNGDGSKVLIFDENGDAADNAVVASVCKKILGTDVTADDKMTDGEMVFPVCNGIADGLVTAVQFVTALRKSDKAFVSELVASV